MEDQGYEWVETTTLEEQANGRKSFLRGRKLNEDRAALEKLRGDVRRFADMLTANPRWVRSTEVADDLKGIVR